MRGVLGADRALGVDELALGERARLGVDDARGLHPVHQRDHHGDDPQARLEDRGEADRQQQRREGHHQVGEAHQRAADPAAEIAGGDADQRADQQRRAIGDDADDQRGARAEEDAGQQVAAEQVGAEPEVGVGRQRRAFQRQPVEDLLVGIVGGEPRREERAGHDDRDDRPGRSPPAAACSRRLSTPARSLAGIARRRDKLRRDGTGHRRLPRRSSPRCVAPPPRC